MWVRGLKLTDKRIYHDVYESHPMWVRGLKLTSKSEIVIIRLSHPMWVRGLKLQNSLVNAQRKSRALCGCVD